MLTSSEFFINNKRIPTRDSKEYDAFFAKELDNIEHGITVNGIYYPGWLYWHLNHWHIFIDVNPDENRSHRIKRKLANPELRDNEWIIAEHIKKAEKLQKGLLIVGSRRFAKTEIAASYTGYNSIIFFGSENMYSSSNEPDLNKISASLKRGYRNLHPYFRPLFLADKWGSGNDVELGFKDTAGGRYEYSKLLIRNTAGGKNTEVGAGSTLNSFLIDEIGKSDWLDFFDAVKPAFESEYGWRCSPIATGTTGNMQKAKELEKVYRDMETFNFISIELKDDNANYFKFFPGHMSLKFKKKEIPLRDFIGQSNSTNKDTIKVTQWDWADNLLETEAEDLKKKGKHTSELKLKMYYPRNEEQMFLTDDSLNPFSDVVPFAKEHLLYLETVNTSEEYGWMTKDGATGKAKFVRTNVSIPIQEWPTGPDEDKDAPIIIWHHPLPGQEFGILHVAGSDPYNQDESYYSPSLGTLYIFRRTYDPINGVGQETFVASYTARPKNIGKWREQVRLLLEYYNATCLPENEEAGNIRWFDEKNIGHYLEDGLNISKEINPNTKNNRNKGLPATTPNIRYGNGVLRNYCLEDLNMGQAVDGEPIIKKGIVRVRDKVLLKEIIGYKPEANGKAKNADRIVGARHALIIAKSKDKYFPIAKVDSGTPREQPAKKTAHGPFNTISRGPFRNKRGPFRR
jgi:hypothetical protein